jgi:hypothetical protein
MDYWCDIVENYDVQKNKGQRNKGQDDKILKKDHGTYSQSSVAILLIYLSFGEDYPYSI